MLKNISQQVYAAISFARGEQADLKQLSALFIENGLLINNKGDAPMIKPVADYIVFIQHNIDAGNIQAIQETEIEAKLEVFGKVAQLRSSYQLDFTTQEASITRYGVNLFQLIKHNEQWLIASMCWDDATDQSLLSSF